jgi:ATP-dependent helicase/nuclease subunit A
MTFTPAQEKAIAARGNVLVMAGAGAGKTRTLVERCLRFVEEGASLAEILIVTFTEAAATELRQRIRQRLEQKANEPTTPRREHWREQSALFEQACIGTLHGFCLNLVREHFYELEVDPQLAVLPEEEARLLAEEALDQVFHEHYSGAASDAKAVLQLLEEQGGSDRSLRQLVLGIHNYTQTLPDPRQWFAEQESVFSNPEPSTWREWLGKALLDWRNQWPSTLKDLAAGNDLASGCLEIIERLPKDLSVNSVAPALAEIEICCANCPKGKKGAWLSPLEDFCGETTFLKSVLPGEKDPLAEDWSWVRGSMLALLRLAQQFAGRYGDSKKELGLADFHDLEQFALRLLWNNAKNAPSPTALSWREKLRFIFVDEYQDINAAQDRIIEALSREGVQANRFLVGDVKQSIYRFRLADPAIFRSYMKRWRGAGTGQGIVIPLVDNFRSREGIIEFINSVFRLVMREGIGGVEYDEDAQLRFGAPLERKSLSRASVPSPAAELHLRLSSRNKGDSDDSVPGAAAALADLQETDKEARLVALRLRQLISEKFQVWHEKDFRDVRWSDMAILLRAPSGKAESYAKEFEKAGVPLRVERGGFYRTLEVTDLISLLQILDNPLQDIPLIAVLHSPLAGFTMNELAEIRLALKGHFWLALQQWHLAGQNGAAMVAPDTGASNRNETPALAQKVSLFLERYSRWRHLARQSSLSRCLDRIIAETDYDAWLLSQNRGAQRHANLQRLLNLAQQFDHFQRQGLYRFLNFVEAQQLAEADPGAASATDENAVRLMSIHQSKGLEFPVVVVPDLGKPFNFGDLRAEIILDEEFGLCPRVRPPHTRKTYPSLAFWLAQKRQTRELLGEELRLLYVAMTRAQDKLILSGTLSATKWKRFQEAGSGTIEEIAAARSYADWLALWFATERLAAGEQSEGESKFLAWKLHDDSGLLIEPAPNGADGSNLDPNLKLDVVTAKALRKRLSWDYPFPAATVRPAKTSVSTLRRSAEELADEETAQLTARPRFRNSNATSAATAQQRGTATHLFLQHLQFEQAGSIAQLQAEGLRMINSGLLPQTDSELLDFESLHAFWKSELGSELRANAGCVRRELAFTARFGQDEIERLLGRKNDPSLVSEFVVVQGVADLVFMLPEEIRLVDFKTDAISPKEVAERVSTYTPQIELYAFALARIYRKPVTGAWLYFLTPKVLERIDIQAKAQQEYGTPGR